MELATDFVLFCSGTPGNPRVYFDYLLNNAPETTVGVPILGSHKKIPFDPATLLRYLDTDSATGSEAKDSVFHEGYQMGFIQSSDLGEALDCKREIKERLSDVTTKVIFGTAQGDEMRFLDPYWYNSPEKEAVAT
ncbi:hypothetical protein N0V90_000644 [Kalmusia sp. IMI 367209]|nr:hypothetical protein N0V90_000644 [Kalmusia sp. IMI 367209]